MGEAFGLPSVLKVDVREEALVVLVGVVEGWCGDEHVVLWPGDLRRQHPGIGRRHPLLLADLDVGDHRDAVVIPWDVGKRS